MRKRKFPYPLLALGVILITGIGFTNMRTALQVDEQERLQQAAAEEMGKPSADPGKESENMAGQIARGVPKLPPGYDPPKTTKPTGKPAPPPDQVTGMWWDDENSVNNGEGTQAVAPKSEKK